MRYEENVSVMDPRETAAILLTIATALLTAGLARRALLRLPNDFLSGKNPSQHHQQHPGPRVTITTLRLALGVGLILAGFVLMALPGPGLLLIASGASLLGVQWPMRFARWLVRQTPILRRVNHLRERNGFRPLDPTCQTPE